MTMDSGINNGVNIQLIPTPSVFVDQSVLTVLTQGILLY